MDITGIIKKINDVQIFDSGFKKRELILMINEKYPQFICIEFFQDRIELLNYVKPGDHVKIFINLKGREWVSNEGVTRYFNSIQGWRIEKIKEAKGMDNENSNEEIINSSLKEDDSHTENEDNFNDLPF